MRQNLQIDVLKEPRGFIKLIQIFVAIFAFATCTGFRGHVEFRQICNTTNHLTGQQFKYPFKATLKFDVHKCSDMSLTQFSQDLDYKSSMEYFVTIGVLCFLYSLGVLVFYIAFEPDQMPTDHTHKFSPPVIDFVISIIFVIAWFSAAIACAASVTGIKNTTDINKIIGKIPQCAGSCKATLDGNYATLDISALIGFLNVFVWCGNLWFLYKETPWHAAKSSSAATVPGGQPAPPAAPSAAI